MYIQNTTMSKKLDWVSLAIFLAFCVLVLESFTGLYLLKLKNEHSAQTDLALARKRKCGCLDRQKEKFEQRLNAKLESSGFCSSVHLCLPKERATRDLLGLRGPDGRRGPKGNRGSPGLPGRPGPYGQRGYSSHKGEQGDKGIPGSRGIKGTEGIPGALGHAGVKGTPGENGAPGLPATAAAEKGDMGMPGFQGYKGATGDAGFVGSPGLPGPQAPSVMAESMKGSRGDKGPRGEMGPIGIPGFKPAEHGDYGELTLECTDGGPSDQPTDFNITCIKGEKGQRSSSPGIDGVLGLPGLMGPKGERGPPGLSGLPGQDGLDGLPGLRGDKGDAGADGANCTCEDDSPVSWRATLLKSYPALPPRKGRECTVFTVEYTKILLVKEADEYTVMVDSSPPTKQDAVKCWATDSTGEFRVFKDIKTLKKSEWWKLGAVQDLDEPAQGCGNVVHAGWFFYHAKDKPKIVKQSLKGGSASKYLDLPVEHTKPLYATNRTHVDLHFDDLGLWAVYADPDTPYINVAKIDPEEMKIEHLLRVNIKHADYAGMEVYDGILYVVETLEDKSNAISYGFDFYEGKPLEVNVRIPLISEPVTRISYNRHKKELLVGVSDWLYTYEVDCQDVQAN